MASAGACVVASAHPGKRPLDSVTLPDGRAQVLWMDHCVQGSRGAALADGLTVAYAELVIRKRYGRDLDSCCAFVEADGATKTGLAGYLRERGFTTVYDAGLATDFCAGFTAMDAARRPRDNPGRGRHARHRRRRLGGAGRRRHGRGRVRRIMTEVACHGRMRE